ncbi:MAG: hypothetical protein ACO3UV_14540 [Pseudomonadales bacterium]
MIEQLLPARQEYNKFSAPSWIKIKSSDRPKGKVLANQFANVIVLGLRAVGGSVAQKKCMERRA